MGNPIGRILRIRARLNVAHNPHRDPEYRLAKAALAASPVPCQLRLSGCTLVATTLDHQPRLMSHTHRRGAGCCALVPACLHCNSSDGRTAATRRDRSGYAWP